jgi:hypothetical protein
MRFGATRENRRWFSSIIALRMGTAPGKDLGPERKPEIEKVKELLSKRVRAARE